MKCLLKQSTFKDIFAVLFFYSLDNKFVLVTRLKHLKKLFFKVSKKRKISKQFIKRNRLTIYQRIPNLSTMHSIL